ncbi:TonB family C-terminal domain-containing protein [Hydrocarboniphaga daqingensis]|uniref:TonB family C-terminal domain-containing protein n=1 Tax=Hydrocarboniphaga daqingensis TaxID=490188 RepID=A0A1M5LM00_9GAMM|nr:energy transducer TonB [Hydrocarboniphaga daqingensis]SHG66097.1 TonB family C-terminal domain-containing protein [Hydrocarboniphaga daqingensis]
MYAATLPTPPPRLSIAFAAAVVLHLAAALSLPSIQQALRDAAERIAMRRAPALEPMATPDVIPVRLPSSLRMTTELGAAIRDNPPSRVPLPPAAGIVRIRLDLSQNLGDAAREAQAAYERLNPTPAPAPAEVVRSVVELRLARTRTPPQAAPDVAAKPATASAIVAPSPAPAGRRPRAATVAEAAGPTASPRPEPRREQNRDREAPPAVAVPTPTPAAASPPTPPTPAAIEPSAATPTAPAPSPTPAAAAAPAPATPAPAAPVPVAPAAEPAIRPQIIYAPPSTTIYRSPQAERPVAPSTDLAAVESPGAAPQVTSAAPALPGMAVEPPARPAGAAVANRAAFFQQLTQHLFTVNQRVLAEAVRASAKVTVEVRFSIDRAGRVLDASVLRGSGNASVDAKAVDVIQRASPVPQMAPDMPQSRIELSFPVQVYQ